MSLERIFEKWIEVTEVSPDCNVITNRNVDIYNYNEKIKSLLKYSGDEMDAVILIDSFLTSFLQSRSVSLFDIYEENPALDSKIKSVREMRNLISSYNIEEYYKEIEKIYKNAANHYGISQEKVDEVLKNRAEFIELKVNSLFAYETFKVKQFKSGNYSDTTPMYNKNIYAFYDVNILLNTVMNSEEFNGITLNAVIDKENFESSYFCFVIKNGENVYLIGDVPEYDSPIQKHIRRTPGRTMARRIELFNFPYELLAIKGDRYGFKSDTTALSVREDYSVLGTLSDCTSNSIVWLINMMALIRDKFFEDHVQTGETYYTGAMIMMEGIEQKEYAFAIRDNYSSIEMKRLSKEDTLNADLKYDRESRGENRWVVDRYIDKVNDSMLNGLSNSDFEDVSYETAISVVDKGNISKLNENYSTIATREELEYRQKWNSRYNLAQSINVLFKKEWDEKRSELEDWYKNALMNNLEELLKAVAFGEFIAEERNYQKLTEKGKEKWQAGEKYSSFSLDGEIISFGRELNKRDINILKVEEYEDDNYYLRRKSTMLFTKDTKNLRATFRYGCVVNGDKATVQAHFKVTSPETMAKLCGIEACDLPDLLRNWNSEKEFFDGNPILSNIDPMDWVIENHGYDFQADVLIILGKKAYNDLRKKYNLPPNKFWLKKEEC